MTNVIRFSRFRLILPIVTVLIIVGGIATTFLGTGLNIGIDFKAGLNMRVQMAPVALVINDTGTTGTVFNLRGEVVTVERTSADSLDKQERSIAEFPTVESLETWLESFEGIQVEIMVPAGTSTASLLTLSHPFELTAANSPVNIAVTPGQEPIGIGAIRESLQSIGINQIQQVGDAANQEFQFRIEEPEDARDFDREVVPRITALLEEEFGVGTALIRQTDYVGARFSENLVQQSVYLSVLALALILVYIWLRFRLAYAVSAIIALIHDALFMFAFIGVTRVEVSTATIAAVLTIIGYSLNDTIVIFDRVRENSGILRNMPFQEVIDTSITQSLSRTLMTSLTTLLAVAAIYAFGSGAIKDFALAMIVGIVIGTYSSIFVASPILLGWTGLGAKRRRSKDEAKYGSAKDGQPKETTEAASTPVQSDPAAPSDTPAEIPMAQRKLKGKRKKRK